MGKDNQLEDRTGEVSYTKYGTKATIIQYINNKKVLVEFDDDYKYRYYTTYINFTHGRLTNPYDKSIYGVGFIGNGNYDSHHISYPVWFNMIKRCYKEQKSYDDESYEDCVVDTEWHNFQNFAKWYEENMYVCNEKLVYVAMCSVDRKTKYIGSYSNPQIAFNHYKEFKEEHINKVLENYIGILPNDVYEEVKKYKIEITD